jgi:hypothetical protein
MYEENSYEVVVGIDFGSSGSGYAYSFMDEHKLYHLDIEGVDVDKKIPTEIILDDKNNVLQFGYKCKQYLKEKGTEAGHYFKDIKMHLYKKESTIKSSNSDKSLPLKIVIQKVLEKLRDICLDQIMKSWKDVQESCVKWVVTVPAIWGDSEKSIMMNACIDAGLVNQTDDKSLFFALEPEAASLYCYKDDSLKNNIIKKGDYYIICDLGGGTGDIVTHLVGNNNSLEEIEPSCGGNYGSNEIDKKIFDTIIYQLFGYKDYPSLLKKYRTLDLEEKDESVLFESWCILEKDIKEFKEGVNINKINEKGKYPICCDVFQDFNENIDLKDLIDKYNNSLNDSNLKLEIKSKKKYIILFPYKILDNYIEEQSKLICKEIKNIISKAKNKTSVAINKLVFVGGYCSNEVLISKIKNDLEKYIELFIKPSNHYLAIMDGAVLFGLNPNIIDIRIAKYTIGMQTRSLWNEEKHSKNGKKVFDEDNKVWRCENCFAKFIEVNQELKNGEEIPPKTFSMVSPRTCTLHFYKSLKPNPIFTFEKGVEKMVECELDAGKDYPLGERDFKVYMKLNGTFIDIKAVHEKSGKFCKVNLKFE